MYVIRRDWDIRDHKYRTVKAVLSLRPTDDRMELKRCLVSMHFCYRAMWVTLCGRVKNEKPYRFMR